MKIRSYLSIAILTIGICNFSNSVSAYETPECFDGRADFKRQTLSCSKIIRSGKIGERDATNRELAMAYTNRSTFVGRNRQIISYTTKAIEYDPTYVPAYLARGNANRMDENFSDAISDYDTVIELEPANEDAYVGKAITLDEMGDVKGAFAELNAAIESDPKNIKAYRARARLWARFKNIPEEIKDYQMILQYSPSDIGATAALKRLGAM